MTSSEIEDRLEVLGRGPVFVDESGRRHGRVRLVGRALGGLVALYVVLVLFGLTGSVSLPVVHFGDVPRLGPAAQGVLERRGKLVPFAGGPKLVDSPRGAAVARTAKSTGSNVNSSRPGAPAPVVVPPHGGGSVPGVPPAIGTGVPTTLAPVTTVPSPPTTVQQGPPTTRPHGHGNGNGPPTSVPGKGHRP
jgi:hypothetical protein